MPQNREFLRASREFWCSNRELCVPKLKSLADEFFGTHRSSTGKAFKSASMGRPTAQLAKLIKDRPELAGLRDMDPRLVILGGGLPIKIGDELVGGIGVGGAPGGHLDEACAQAGLKKIGAQ
jgi:uncharacterized protein GlcG (DUF336 family)